MEFRKFLGLEFADTSLDKLIEEMASKLNADGKSYIVTPNPEIFLTSWGDGSFAKVLKGAWFNCADGFGLQWAYWFKEKFESKSPLFRSAILYPSIAWFWLSGKSKESKLRRITGVDLMSKFLIWQNEVPVFLLGAAPGVAEEVIKQFPYSEVVGCYAGSPDSKDTDEIIERINATPAKVLFVAYGAPAQELWISKNLSKLNNVSLAIGVGGAFDFLSGRVERAPEKWQKLGLEWLWRLFKQPWRWRRIFNAVVVFPYKFLKQM